MEKSSCSDLLSNSGTTFPLGAFINLKTKLGLLVNLVTARKAKMVDLFGKTQLKRPIAVLSLGKRT